MPFNPNLFSELEWRGIVKQITDPALPGVLSTKPLTVYVGFDPTSDTLHVGSLLPLMTLMRFQRSGHRVLAVAGGATGMIGDPSGKTDERSLLNQEMLEKNLQGIKKTLSRFLRLDGDNPAQVLNNADWFAEFSYIDFLRDVGKHFTVNHMIAKESVRSRLDDREHGISYTEFSYILLQAYDFYFLCKKENCTLQVGGSDQWGNITAGIELIRRMQEGKAVYGLTHPLVMKSDGTKFGKTERGTVWLDAEKTSPYQFYQFLIQVDDADVLKFLRYFTFLSREKIEALEASLKTEPEKRLAQRALAAELTKLVHGAEELKRAEEASQALFGSEIRSLDKKTLLEVFSEAPTTSKPLAALSEGGGLPLLETLVETGLCSSKGMARKEMTAGGIYVNNERITDIAARLLPSHLIAGACAVLRRGKRTVHLLSFH